MARPRVEISTQRTYRVAWCDSELIPGQEQVFLESPTSVPSDEILVCREEPELRFQVVGSFFSNPPSPNHACVLSRVGGEGKLRVGMVLVPESEA